MGRGLRVRARRFPALVHCTTVDWFHLWPAEALRSVSHRFIQEIEGIQVRVSQSGLVLNRVIQIVLVGTSGLVSLVFIKSFTTGSLIISSLV